MVNCKVFSPGTHKKNFCEIFLELRFYSKPFPPKSEIGWFSNFGGRTTDVNTLLAGAFPAQAVSQYRFMSNIVEKKKVTSNHTITRDLIKL